jgi:benzoyl-CoA reductase subunit C
MDYKKQGKKVIGFFCSYIPEEIIYAGGMLPYRIRPAGCQEFGRTFGVAL